MTSYGLILKTLIAAATIAYTTNLVAGNAFDVIKREQIHRDQIIRDVLKNEDKNSNFINNQKNSAQQIKEKLCNHQDIIETLKNKNMSHLKIKDDTKQAPQAMIFVSFSMPDLSLKQIINDAAKYQVPVVIRGLYQNSFRKTIERIFELVKENNQGGILINPIWFEEYDIKSVPAVVVSGKNDVANESNQNKKLKKIDIVYGNIRLKQALEIIAERGEVAEIAANILKKRNQETKDKTRKQKNEQSK